MAGGAPQMRLYWLADLPEIKAQESTIRRIVLDVLGVTDVPRHEVRVSGSSGWISYEDTEQMWRQGGAASLPRTQEEAARRAEDFLVRLAGAFTTTPARGALPEFFQRSHLVPPVRPVETVLVPRPDGSAFDHWLHRAQPQLADGTGEQLDVLGAGVDVRIGSGGQVISFFLRWRALTDARKSVGFEELVVTSDPHTEGGHAHLDHHPLAGDQPDRRTTRIVYLSEGDGVPQYYLAPYHIVDTGHLYELAPASTHSLLVAYSVKSGSRGESEVTAVVLGGSGRYDFEWAMTAIDPFDGEPAVVELGSGFRKRLRRADGREIEAASAGVPPGVAVVMVNVRDRATGAFKHHQQLLASYPYATRREPPLVA